LAGNRIGITAASAEESLKSEGGCQHRLLRPATNFSCRRAVKAALAIIVQYAAADIDVNTACEADASTRQNQLGKENAGILALRKIKA